MFLIEDTRNQIGKHRNIELYCKRHDITLIRKKLEIGDYMLSLDGETPFGNISIDTKQDMLEISKDIMSNDHRRFKAECQRAKEWGIQLIILIEETVPFGQVDLWDVPIWRTSNRYHRYGDPMTLVNPAALKKAMLTMSVKYGVKFRYCNKRETPRKVIRYLKGELK